MLARPRPRRLALLTSTALITGGLALGTPTALAQVAAMTPSPATTHVASVPAGPRLAVSWDVLHKRCRAHTRRRHVAVHHHTRTETKHVRSCTTHPVNTHSSHVHLGWRHRGVAFGHLTLAGAPIANATITVSTKVTDRAATTETLTTNARGRFQAPLTGPNKTVTFSYSPTPGEVFARTGYVSERAFLSFNVGRLRAGKRARFSGIVFGGPIPQGLYVQFSYLAARSGWQPFARLAEVARHNGHWHAAITIPLGDRGYRYKIRATVVPARSWPYLSPTSRVLTRIVS